jgi:hypothetical protein
MIIVWFYGGGKVQRRKASFDEWDDVNISHVINGKGW